MNHRDPKIGDLVMLMRGEVVTLPPKPKRGRPSKKNPLNIQTETRWHEDGIAIVVVGPNQGISCDGEDYWLEWTVQRLDNGAFRMIASGAPHRSGGIPFKVID